MTGGRPPRASERGNSLLLAMIVMSALGTLGSLTIFSVQTSLRASTNERAHAIALYAAESGAAYGMDYLRWHWDNRERKWDELVSANNSTIKMLPFASNEAPPGSSNNPFSADQNAWFRVEVLNNIGDPEFANATWPDGDWTVVIRSTGHGPQGSVAVIEWEVKRVADPVPPLDDDLDPLRDPKTNPPVPPNHPLILRKWRVVL